MRTRGTLFLLFSVPIFLLAAHAQSPDSAKSFVQSLYSNYSAGKRGVDFTGAGAHRYFSSNFIALRKKDQEAAAPDMPVYGDADPICDCQDWDGIWQLEITVQMTGRTTAEALASFAISDPHNNPDGQRSVRFRLVQEHRGWRIDEACTLHSNNPPFCLCEEMRKEIQESANARRSPPR